MKMLGHKGLSTECPLIFIIQNAGLESSISENNVPELATLPKIKSKLPYGFFCTNTLHLLLTSHSVKVLTLGHVSISNLT